MDFGLFGQDFFLELCRNQGGDGGKMNHIILKSTPVALTLPGTIHGALDCRDHVVAPVPHGGDEDSVITDHASEVSIVANGIFATLDGCFGGFCSILVLSNYVATLIEQGNSSLALQGRIIPRVGPYDSDGGLWIDSSCTTGKAVDCTYNFRSVEGTNKTEFSGRGHLCSDHT